MTMDRSRPVITLLTDFGIDDFYVGAMKGVILDINPAAAIVDITHSIRPQDVHGAGFILAECFRTFPPGTIHVAVVDPGVGSERKPLLISAGGFYFIGPDNGIFSFVLAETEAETIIHITNDEYFHKPVSSTFHGRDIFSPAAAWLSTGSDPRKFGPQISGFMRFTIPHSIKKEDGSVQGEVIHVDRFGNLITNISVQDVLRAGEPERKNITVMMNGRPVARLLSHFAESAPGEPLAYFGSTGRLEIAVNKGSAQQVLNAEVGTALTFKP